MSELRRAGASDRSVKRRSSWGTTKLLSDISRARAAFESAVKKARQVTPELDEAREQLIARVLGDEDGRGEFAELEETARRAELEERVILEHAQQLAGLRAYVLPASTLGIEAGALYAEMSQWQLPDKVLAYTKDLLDKECSCDKGDEGRVRAAMNAIIEQYDYWDSYTDWFFHTLKWATMLLGLLFVATLLGAVWLLSHRHPTLGFFLAGTSGATVSVLMRLPVPSVYGEAVGLFLRMAVRLATGTAAAALGLGLFATGLIDLPLKNGNNATSLLATVNGCADGSGCSAVYVALLLALGMLLGFSERSLGAVEQAVFGGLEKLQANRQS